MPTTFEEVMDFHPDNRCVYEEIRDSLGVLLPFIGSGLTAGVYGTWDNVFRELGGKLTDQRSIAQLDTMLRERDYVDAAQFLEDRRGRLNLTRDLAHHFSADSLSESWAQIKDSAIWLLPELFTCPILTTNFDEAIENVYARRGVEPFPVVDISSPNLLPLASRLRNAPCVFKLRGTVAGAMTDYSRLVFTRSQYEMFYGPDRDAYEALRRIIAERPLLFLGCSTFEVISDILRDITGLGSLRYAVVSCSVEKRDSEIRALADANTRAIVYENGRYESVRLILRQLIEDVGISEPSVPTSAETNGATNLANGNKHVSGDDLSQVIARVNSRLVRQREGHPSFRRMGHQSSYDLLPSGLMKVSNEPIRNSQRLLRTGDNEEVSLRDFLRRSWESSEQNHPFIVGRSGMGKTVALLTLATEPGFLPKDVPAVYMPLADLAQYSYAGRDCIDQYLDDKFSAAECRAIQELSREPWVSGPNVILLLDGHNEIPADSVHDVDLGIRAWSMRPGTQLVIASRTPRPFVAENTVWFELQGLAKDDVRGFLRSRGIAEPEPDSRLWQLLTTPLMLAIYADVRDFEIEALEEYHHLPIKPTDNAGHLVWDFLLRELLICAQRSHRNYSKADYAVALLLTLPYVCWQMETAQESVISPEKLYAYVREACQRWRVYGIPSSFRDVERALLLDSDAHVIKGSPRSQLHILADETALLCWSGGTYSIIHSGMLEGLAAIHLKNVAEAPCDKLPSEFTHPISGHAMDFLVDICEVDPLLKIWDANRRQVLTDDTASRNLLRAIHAKCAGDLSKLDFSNMDIRGVSLLPFRNGITLDVSRNPDRFRHTVLDAGCFSWRGRVDAVSAMCFSPDPSISVLAIGSSDGNILLWDYAHMLQSGPLYVGHQARVRAVCFSPDGALLASCSDDGTVRLWDTATGKQVGSPLAGHRGLVLSVCFSPDGNLLASSSTYGTVDLWDVATGKRVGSPLAGHGGIVRSVCFSPDGRLLASCSDDGAVRLWDVATGSLALAPLEGHGGVVRSVCFSPDGTLLASGSNDGAVRLWDTTTGEQVRAPLEVRGGVVRSVCFSPDGVFLASCSDDGAVRLWDVATGALALAPLKGHGGIVRTVCFSPDGRLLAGNMGDGSVILWDTVKGVRVDEPLEGRHGGILGVCFSPDGTLIAGCLDDGTARLWDVAAGGQVGAPLEARGGVVRSVCFSPDGTLLASGSDDGTVRLWDVTAGGQVGAPLEGRGGVVRSVCFSPDGTLLASGSDDGCLRIWDVTNRFLSASLVVGRGSVPSVCFSPDGRLVACGSADGAVRVWDVTTSGLVASVDKHREQVRCVCFSPDGTILASGSDDGTVRLWSPVERRQVGVLAVGRHGFVTSVYFSPDGQWLAIGSEDGTVQQWNPTSHNRSPREQVGSPGSRINSVSFSPDGTTIASGSEDGLLRIANGGASPMTVYPLPGISIAGLDFSEAIVENPHDRMVLRQNGAIV